MKKISISKESLVKLYVGKDLSTYAIARMLQCDPSVIQRRVTEYGITKKKPNQEIKLSKERLKHLYCDQKLSTYKIAEEHGCDPKTIYRKLKLHKIKTRPVKKIDIPKEDLYHFYHVKKLPLSKIAEIFSCAAVTIFDRMNRYNIPSRSLSEAGTIYPKKDFSGDLVEKAYLVGFRLGDLNVYRRHHLIYVQSSTTKLAQIHLIKKLFRDYGKLHSKNYGDVTHLQVGLNQSFSFLVPKRDSVSRWILNNNKFFLAFLAGYTDAEGSIGSYKNRPRIRVRTYDKNILYLMHKKLHKMGVASIYRIELPAGRYNLKKDFWALSINRRKDVMRLGELLGPYLQHQKRRMDLDKALGTD